MPKDTRIEGRVLAAYQDKLISIDDRHSYQMHLALFGGHMKGSSLQLEGQLLKDRIHSEVIAALEEAALNNTASLFRKYLSMDFPSVKPCQCYDVAWKLFRVLDKSVSPILVHAIVTGRGKIEGQKYGHAWVEFNGLAVDQSQNLVMPVSDYREEAKADLIIEYDFSVAMENAALLGTSGPWDPRIKQAIHSES